MKPRIFLGSSGQQEKLLQALTRGLQDIADVEPWTTVFNPGVSTLERLVELTREVDFAAFVFAQDDWTTKGASPVDGHRRGRAARQRRLRGGPVRRRARHAPHVHPPRERRQAPHRPARADLGPVRPRHHAGLSCARSTRSCGTRSRRKAVISRLQGDWWQLSLTARTELEPSSVSLLTISRNRAGALEVAGRSWQADGTLSARYWSEASKERVDPAGIFYYWNGERPRHPDAPQLEGTGEIKLESVDRANGYFTTRSGRRRRVPRTDLRDLPPRRPG